MQRSAKNDVQITDNLDFFARYVVEGFLTGLHKSPYHGFSVEFAEHRLYNPGESIKNIDWKLFARSEKLFIKKFEEETNLRSYILIDTSSSMQYPEWSVKSNKLNKLSFSIYAAACLIHLFHKQRDGFGLSFYNERLDLFTKAKNSKAHYNRLMAELDKELNNDRKEKNIKTNFSSIVSSLIEKIPKRSLIIIFSDMLDSDNLSKQHNHIFEAFQQLRYRNNEVVLFHVQHLNDEKLFNFSNNPYEFIDLENNKHSIKMNPFSYQEKYQISYNKFQEKIDLMCNQHQIEYIPAFVEDGFTKVLLTYLTKRAKLF